MNLQPVHLRCSSFRGTQLRSHSVQSLAPARQGLDIRAMKEVSGTVVSVQMNKTAVIQVDRYIPHRIYGKRVRKSRKFFAHDEEESCKVGDLVRVVSIRPVSKNKSFKVDKILTTAD